MHILSSTDSADDMLVNDVQRLTAFAERSICKGVLRWIGRVLLKRMAFKDCSFASSRPPNLQEHLHATKSLPRDLHHFTKHPGRTGKRLFRIPISICNECVGKATRAWLNVAVADRSPVLLHAAVSI